MMPEIPHWLWLATITAFVVVVLFALTIELIGVLNRKAGDTLTELTMQHAHIPSIGFFLLAGIPMIVLVWALYHFIIEEG